MDYIQEMFAERIGGSRFGMSDVIYKFEKIKRSKREAAELHPDMELIDLGVGLYGRRRCHSRVVGRIR